MSRHLITISSTRERARVMKYVCDAPFGTRVEFKATHGVTFHDQAEAANAA
jgi:hypothetical protein